MQDVPREHARAVARDRVVVTVGLLALFAAGYFGVAAWTEGARLVSLSLPADDRIPFVPAGVLVYATVYTAWSIPLFVVASPVLFRRVARAYLFVLLISFAGFVLLPASAAPLRVHDASGDDFVSWGLRLLYALDPPTNCFPSLHVGLATIVALLVARIDRGAALLSALWWSAVCLSTLVTGQHYVVDVAGGALVGGLAGAVALAGLPRGLEGAGWAGLARYALAHTAVMVLLIAAWTLGA